MAEEHEKSRQEPDLELPPLLGFGRKKKARKARDRDRTAAPEAVPGPDEDTGADTADPTAGTAGDDPLAADPVPTREDSQSGGLAPATGAARRRPPVPPPTRSGSTPPPRVSSPPPAARPEPDPPVTEPERPVAEPERPAARAVEVPPQDDPTGPQDAEATTALPVAGPDARAEPSEQTREHPPKRSRGRSPGWMKRLRGDRSDPPADDSPGGSTDDSTAVGTPLAPAGGGETRTLTGARSGASAVSTASHRGQVVEDEPLAPHEEDSRVEPAAARRGSSRKLPVINPKVAAVVTGLVVGLVTVVLTFLANRGCEGVRGVGSCGRLGLLALLVVVVLAAVLGATLLKAWRVVDPTITAILGVGLMAVFALLFLLEALESPWMLLVLPVVTAVAFLASEWITTALVEDSGDSHR